MHDPTTQPVVVHVKSKSGGITRAIMFVLALGLFALVFLIGIGIGAVGSSFEAPIDAGLQTSIMREGSSDRIAVIPIEGVIDSSTSRFVAAACKRIRQDGRIKAVVLRVDSPGGGVSASDQIWHELERLRADSMTVVASFGGMAASGGYYVSCAADTIVAEPTCTTGSIGVIAQIMTMEDLMEKVGIEPVTLVATGSPQKHVANDIFRTWDDADRSKIMVMLDDAYTTFQQRVLDGRTDALASAAAIDTVADGSVFTATEALDLGLVDAIGYLDDAITTAENVAGLTKGRSEVITLRPPQPLFGPGMLAQRSTALDLDATEIRRFVNELAAPRIMYLAP
ncbi:MAG: signal peptide peptidase SppA [Planctomycetota bacterium]